MSQQHADQSAERQYLASVMSDPSTLERYRVEPRDMAWDAHRDVLRALVELVDGGESFDVGKLRNRLEVAGRLERVGGIEGLVSLMEPPQVSAESLRERILSLSEVRSMREGMVEALNHCDAHRTDAAVETLNRIVESVRAKNDRKIVSFNEAMRSAVAHVASEASRSGLVPTGLGVLDYYVGGLSAGDMLTIGGPTNVGKSWVTLFGSHSTADKKRRVGVISLEDPEHLWGSRGLSIEAGVNSGKIRQARGLSREDMGKIEHAVKTRHLDLYMAMSIGANYRDVIQDMRRLVHEYGCEIVWVDYAQCLYGVEGAATGHQAQKIMYTHLKAAAARLGVPLVLLSQISRGENPDREPSKYDLKEGGDLEIKSEFIVMIWRESGEGANPNVVKAKIDKSKVRGVGTRWWFEQQDSGALKEFCYCGSPIEGKHGSVGGIECPLGAAIELQRVQDGVPF